MLVPAEVSRRCLHQPSSTSRASDGPSPGRRHPWAGQAPLHRQTGRLAQPQLLWSRPVPRDPSPAPTVAGGFPGLTSGLPEHPLYPVCPVVELASVTFFFSFTDDY